MRKSKHKPEDAKSIRTALPFKGSFRSSGISTYTGTKTTKRSTPTGIRGDSISQYIPSLTSTRPVHRLSAGDDTASVGQKSSESRALEFLSSDVIQVVEELMEQTCTLKARIVDMVAKYQEKICECSQFECYCGMKRDVNCGAKACAGDGSICETTGDAFRAPAGSIHGTSLDYMTTENAGMSAMEGGRSDLGPCRIANCICSNHTRSSGGQLVARSTINKNITNDGKCLEMQDSIRIKLAKAQSDIEELRSQVKGFVNCTCKQKERLTGGEDKMFTENLTNRLIGDVNNIRTQLNNLNLTSMESPGPSGMTVTTEQPVKDESIAQIDTEEAASRKTNTSDAVAKAKSVDMSKDKTPDKTIREVNTVRQNDVVYSQDGRVLKKVEKVERTEIVQQNHADLPTDEGNSRTIESTAKSDNARRNDAKPNILSKSIEGSLKRTRKKNSPHDLSSDGSALSIRNKHSDTSLRHRAKKRSEGRDRKHSEKASHPPTISPHTSRFSRSYSATSDSSMGLSISSRHRKRHRNHHNRHNGRNDEPLLVREYLYSNNSKESPRNARNSQKIGMIGCKFSDKSCPPQHSLNLSGKTSTYFIEVKPKRSHSFNGATPDPVDPQTSNNSYADNQLMNRRPSGSNLIRSRAYTIPHYSSLNSERYRAGLGESSKKLASDIILTHKLTKVLEKSIDDPTRIKADGTSVELPDDGVPVIQSVSLQRINSVIRQLAGKRSPKDFFISVLPEKKLVRNMRINVVDKDSGTLLGYFFVSEEDFQRARTTGLFDNYLSLFVLNSLGSYTDFVSIIFLFQFLGI